MPIPSQKEAVEGMNPYYPFMRASVMESWHDFLEYRSDRSFSHLNERQSANWLTTQINYRLKEMLEEKTGIQVVEQFEHPVFVFDEKIAITTKKLTLRLNKKTSRWEYTRCNYPTERSKEFWGQRPVESVPQVPRFILGYELLNEVTEIKIFLAYPKMKGKGMEWVYSIPQMEPSNMRPRIAVLDAPEDQHDESKGYEIVGVDESSEAVNP